MPKNKEWSIYIIETECGKLYTGIAKDPEKRFEEHLNSPKGAKFLKAHKPRKIVFKKAKLDRSQALKLEAKIKKLTRAQKLKLIDSGQLPTP